MAIKWRLSLTYSAALLLVMVVAAFWGIRGAREDVRAEMQSTRLVLEHVLDMEPPASGAKGSNDGRFDLIALRGARHFRIEYVDTNGRVIETSRGAFDVGRAEAPEWFTALVSPLPTPPPIRKAIVVDGQPLGELVVRPDPANEVAEKWQNAKELAQTSLLLFIVVNGVLYIVVARSLRPIDRILDILSEVEDGNMRVRLPPFSMLEFQKIGARFNRMANALERSAQENQRLTLKLIQVQEEEQRRLARELHDELGQSVTAIQADAAALVRSGQQNPLVLDSATAIVTVTQQMLASIRGMLHRLRPEALDEFGLTTALRELIEAWQRRNPDIACKLSVDSRLDIGGGDTALALYRGVQEALTNVARHSAATRVEIELRKTTHGTADRLTLVVSDNGRGTTRAQMDRGSAVGMRERAGALGGSLVIRPDTEAGFRLELALPIEQEVACL